MNKEARQLQKKKDAEDKDGAMQFEMKIAQAPKGGKGKKGKGKKITIVSNMDMQ